MWTDGRTGGQEEAIEDSMADSDSDVDSIYHEEIADDITPIERDAEPAVCAHLCMCACSACMCKCVIVWVHTGTAGGANVAHR